MSLFGPDLVCQFLRQYDCLPVFLNVVSSRPKRYSREKELGVEKEGRAGKLGNENNKEVTVYRKGKKQKIF